MDTPAISTRVHIDLHPDALSNHSEALLGRFNEATQSHERENTVGAAAYHAAREVLTEVYQWHAGVEEADAALKATNEPQQRRAETWGNGERPNYPKHLIRNLEKPGYTSEQEFLDAAMQGMNKVLQATDRKMTTVTNAINHLTSEIAKATEDTQRMTPHGIALASEIRGHLKSLKDTERMDFVRHAIANDDKTTAAAVLKVPGFLSGLKDNEHAGFRTMAEKTWAPVHFDQHRSLLEIHERLESARGTLMQRYARLEHTVGKTVKAKQHASKALSKLANGGR